MKKLRRAVEPRLRRWWNEPGPAGALFSAAALPAEVVYRLAVGVRNAAYDSGVLAVSRAPIPVLSVGNLTVGGSGKTPVSAWMVSRLLALGAHPAILLRGYGNDEVLLHGRWNPTAHVLPDPNRVASARAAARLGADVVVLDDGFQHRRLARDLDVVLIAAEQPLPGHQLPRGPFRESAASLTRADLVVVTRRSARDQDVAERVRTLERLAAAKPVVVLRLVAGGWTDLSGTATDAPGADVLAVTSVADPGSFESMVSQETRNAVELLSFPDHHAFDADDAREIARLARGRPVAVTEKDAVKLVDFQNVLPPLVRVLTLTVRPESGAELLENALGRIAQQARAYVQAPLETKRATPDAESGATSPARSGAHA